MKRILILGLTLVIALGLIQVTRQNALQAAYRREYDAAARVLRIERSRVESELNQVKLEMSRSVIGKGCGVLLFEELKESIYTDVLPILAQKGYSGILVLSEECFPGKEGCLTVEEFLEIMLHGWNAAIYWDDFYDLNEYTRTMQQRWDALELGLEYPTILYPAVGDYRDNRKNMIRKAGYTQVICHGEDGTAITREYTEDPFLIESFPWNLPAARDLVVQTAEYGGSVVMTCDFSSRYGRFHDKNFRSFLAFLEEKEDTFYLGNLAAAQSNLIAADSDRNLRERCEYLESEIDRYNQEIDTIYQLDLSQLSK